MSDMKIPEDLQGWYEVLNQHRQNSARCSCNEVCKLIERIAALEAERDFIGQQLRERDADYVRLKTERDAFQAQLERLTDSHAG